MKNLLILGAGDFGRESMWVAERMNKNDFQWNLLGFVDDALAGQAVDGYPVLGDIDWLIQYNKPVYAVCAIGSGAVRQSIWNKLSGNPNIQPATLIDPAVIVGRDVTVAPGSIICAGTILAIAVNIGRHCIVNLNCSIGHDTVLEDFATVHPGSNLSGKVRIGTRSFAGTGTKIVQGVSVSPDVTLGAGAVVVRDLEEEGTYVGVPVKKIK